MRVGRCLNPAETSLSFLRGPNHAEPQSSPELKMILIHANTDAAIARLWQPVWDLTEGVLECREYRSTSRDTLSCPRLVARSVRPPSGTAGQ
eukprot:358687-Chlamydomonas_euryale.AAC.1